MKKSAMFLGMMMMSTLIFAQRQPHDSKAMGERRSERFKKELSLSDDQVNKVKAIRVKFGERHKAIRRDSAMSQGTARKEQKKLKAEQETELKGVLTPEQWTKYTAMKAKHKEHRKKLHHARPERG